MVLMTGCGAITSLFSNNTTLSTQSVSDLQVSISASNVIILTAEEITTDDEGNFKVGFNNRSHRELHAWIMPTSADQSTEFDRFYVYLPPGEQSSRSFSVSKATLSYMNASDIRVKVAVVLKQQGAIDIGVQYTIDLKKTNRNPDEVRLRL